MATWLNKALNQLELPLARTAYPYPFPLTVIRQVEKKAERKTKRKTVPHMATIQDARFHPTLLPPQTYDCCQLGVCRRSLQPESVRCKSPLYIQSLVVSRADVTNLA